MKRIAVVVALLLAAAVAGWWWLAAERGPLDVTIAADAPLRYVPADSPYVFATLAPMPEAVVARWEQDLARVVALWQAPMEQLRRQVDSDGDPTLLALLALFEDEFAGKSPRDALATLGLGPDLQMALYGLGALPVLRVQLAEPERLRGFLQRVEAAAGQRWPQAQVDGQPYWQLADGHGQFAGLVAIVDRQLVASIAPLGADPAALRQILGLERPDRSLADSGELQQIAATHGLLAQFVGVVHSDRLLAALTGPASTVDIAFLTALGIDKPRLEGACDGEWRALADTWPGMVFGYTRLEPNRVDTRLLLPLRADLAAELQRLRAPMPGLAAIDEPPVAHVGLALQVGELPALVGRLADRVAQAPWQCESLQPLNEAFAQAQSLVVNPAVYAAAPAASSVHVALGEFRFDAGAQALPDVSARLAIGSPNPAALLALASNALPSLRTLDLQPDGVPRLLTPPAGVALDGPLHIAMTRHAIGLSLGAAEAARLGEFLTIDPAQQPVLVSGISGRFYTLIAEQAARQAAQQGGDPLEQQQIARAAAQIQQLYGETIERTEARLELGADGIELLQSTTLR